MATRRQVLRAGVGGMALVASVTWRNNKTAFAAPSRDGQLTGTRPAMTHIDMTAAEAALAIRNGDITAEAYTQSLLAQSTAWQSLNALISQDAESLLEAAREADIRRREGQTLGPLHGVPLVLKDNIDTTALPTTGGTGALRNHQPRRNAPIAQALFDAGALLLGKANMHELAMGVTSNNGVFGAVRNPYDQRMIPGGSSGGTGAAVGARIAPAGLGSDTGGSVRIPAALCGTTGLRPSSGRYPGAGIIPISTTNDTAGPLARDVGDLALLDGVITGDNTPISPLALKEIRLGVHRPYFWQDLDPEIAGVMEQTLDRLQAAGVTLVEAEIADFEALRAAVGRSFAQYEGPRALTRYLTEHDTGLSLEDLVAGIGSPDVQRFWGLMFSGNVISEETYQQAHSVHRPRFQAAYTQYFKEHNIQAMIFPATPAPARPIGQDQTIELNGRQVSTFATYTRNSGPAASAGIPGLVLPAGLTAQGLPVGLELNGPTNSDRQLLGLGLTLETILPKLPPPPMPAT